MKMVDVVLNIDSLFLKKDETIEDVINYLREKYDFGYDPTYDILYEEYTDENYIECSSEYINELEDVVWCSFYNKPCENKEHCEHFGEF